MYTVVGSQHAALCNHNTHAFHDLITKLLPLMISAGKSAVCFAGFALQHEHKSGPQLRNVSTTITCWKVHQLQLEQLSSVGLVEFDIQIMAQRNA